MFLLDGAVNLASEFSPLLDTQLRISAENESDDRTYVVSANKVIHKLLYRVFIKYCVFSLKFCDFSELCSSVAALVFYLPGVCTHTDTKGKQSPEYFYKFGKKHNI